MFAGKAGAPLYKHYTRLEKLARDKRMSLLRKFINYEQIEFYNFGPGPNAIKKFP
jgi:hypothetical protein